MERDSKNETKMKIRKFKNKKEAFKYIKKKYSSAEAILIKGSVVRGEIKEFSDIDIEFYQDKPAKPEYELILVDNKLVLITAYPYKAGKKINNVPENVLVLKGNYCKQIENQKPYSKQERTIRDNQMFLDFLFKYLRTKDSKYLKTIEKYSRLK